ncbi:hypothetical protein [Nonomuraea sp. NPDC052265]|uniref:hypothetical protein n=1 Tax=Nonomuraea sp. NPDC052265 TaxID=3364374 RepID=UPI0037C636FC
MSGLKSSPSWHAGLYRRALADRTPSHALVCGSSDETMPQVLTRIVPGLRLTVADACSTPLQLVEAWAAWGGADVATVRSHAPDLAGLSGPFDVIVTDGLLSLLPTPADRNALITRLAGLLADDGVLIYTTRIAGRRARLEYDRPGRVVQALAAAAWPAPPAERLRLARHRLQRPSRPSPFTAPEQVADAFRGGFDQVRVVTRTAAPTLALAMHPAFLTGRGSVCVGVTATHPRSQL